MITLLIIYLQIVTSTLKRKASIRSIEMRDAHSIYVLYSITSVDFSTTKTVKCADNIYELRQEFKLKKYTL